MIWQSVAEQQRLTLRGERMKCHCKICKKRFNAVSKRDQHMLLAHGVEPKKPKPELEEDETPALLAPTVLAEIPAQPAHESEPSVQGGGGESGGAGASASWDEPPEHSDENSDTGSDDPLRTPLPIRMVALIVGTAMASSYATKCPKCGGKATWNTDDGITYCDEKNCRYFGVEYEDYRPPSYRGGIGTNEPPIMRRKSEGR